MQDIFTSFIRTTVPIIVGSVVAFLAARGVNLDDNAVAGLTAFLSGLFSAVYYLLVRVIEKRYPQAGWLLGSPKPPTYGSPDA